MLFTFQASKLKYIISESKNIPLSIVFPYRLTIDLPEAVLGSMCMVLGTIKKWFSFPTAAECARSFMKKKKKNSLPVPCSEFHLCALDPGEVCFLELLRHTSLFHAFLPLLFSLPTVLLFWHFPCLAT